MLRRCLPPRVHCVQELAAYRKKKEEEALKMSVLDAEAAARFSTAAALDARDQLAIPASGGLLIWAAGGSWGSLAFVRGGLLQYLMNCCAGRMGAAGHPRTRWATSCLRVRLAIGTWLGCRGGIAYAGC